MRSIKTLTMGSEPFDGELESLVQAMAGMPPPRVFNFFRQEPASLLFPGFFRTMARIEMCPHDVLEGIENTHDVRLDSCTDIVGPGGVCLERQAIGLRDIGNVDIITRLETIAVDRGSFTP